MESTGMNRPAQKRRTYVDDVKAMAAEGMATLQIAKEVGLSPVTVYKIADEAGIPIRAADRETTQYSVRAIRERAYDMPPLDAVEFLLGILEDLTGSKTAPPVTDFVNKDLRGPVAFIYAMLLSRVGQVVPTEFIHAALYRDRTDDTPDPKILTVYFCKLRRILPPTHTLENVRGYGYRLIIEDPDKKEND